MEKIFNESSSQPQLVKFRSLSESTNSLAIKNVQTASNESNIVAENDLFIKLGFPEPILYYLKKNANSKLLLKLMKSSKRHFSFKEFPYFVVNFLKIDKSQWTYFDQKSNEISTLNLSNLPKPLWITKGIECDTNERATVLSNLLAKTFICDIKSLRIVGRILTYKQLKFMNAKKNIENFTLFNSHVECCLCSIVSMDEIVKCLPNVKKFLWLFSRAMALTITPKSTKKLIEALNPSILTSFSLMNVPATFDFKLFSKFMKKNPSIDFFLEFNNIPIKFSKMLQKYVDKLIKNAPKNYQPIRIRFPNQTDPSRNALDLLHQIHTQSIF